jgi:NAD-dependent SIR2 family protein deacetylase
MESVGSQFTVKTSDLRVLIDIFYQHMSEDLRRVSAYHFCGASFFFLSLRPQATFLRNATLPQRHSTDGITTMNPNELQVLYPDEVTSSIYWQERASHHHQSSYPTSEDLNHVIRQAAKVIAESDAILFVTGAGMGVDMGLPDFRTSSKFWKDLNHRDITRYEDSSDIKWFEQEPDFMWGLNYHQISMYREAAVHDGYLAISELIQMKAKSNYFCYTSNIDGVLQRCVGLNQMRIREIHGNIHRLQCTRYDCSREVWEEKVELEYDPVTFCATTPLPVCRNCGQLARPNVWYCKDGQYVLDERSRAISEEYERWIHQMELSHAKIAVIECGAGLVIPSARIESELICERLNGALVRINPVDHMVPVEDLAEQYRASIGIPLGAREGLTRILAEVKHLLA